MKTIKLTKTQKGILKVKLKYSTLCTWHYKYLTFSDNEFLGDSQQNTEHNHDLDKVEKLINTTDEFDSLISNTTTSEQDYSLKIEWWFYPDDKTNNPEMIESETYKGKLALNSSEPIMETFIFEYKD